MKKRGKKGISPLIATVLLIGFVIAVAVIVMTWGKGFVKERAEKEGALSQAQLQCNQVEIEIDDNFYITNIGSIEIGGFIIRDKDGGSTQKPDPLPVLGRTSWTANKGDLIIPAIRPEGAGAPLVQCSDKSIKLREDRK